MSKRGPESRFWSKVRKAWPGHAQRVEASHGDADAGTPDAVLSYGNRGGWIETKVWPEELRKMQLPWHIDAIQRGAYARVLCDLGKGEVWLGLAYDYQWHLDQRKKPRGYSLQAAITMIRCGLTGARS